MELKKDKVIAIISSIVYVVLYFWPAYLIFFYMATVGNMKIAALLLIIVIELGVGLFLSIRQLKKMKESKKIGSRVLFGVVAGTYSIYIVSIIVFFIRVLIRSLS